MPTSYKDSWFLLLKKYVKHNEDFESLLRYESEQLTDILEVDSTYDPDD